MPVQLPAVTEPMEEPMAYEFTVSDVLPATPEAIYEAWMSSEGHAGMTGAGAQVDPRVGGEFSAWDGYITGRTLVLEPGRRIVQSWRTSEFEATDHEYQIEIVLDRVLEGTKITLHHANIPDGQSGYEQGWRDNYFDPMRDYFTNPAAESGARPAGRVDTEWLIRDAEPDRDAAACLSVYAPFVRDTIVSFEEQVPSLEEFRQRIRSTIPAYPWLVLEVGGEVVGYAYASQHRSRAAYRWAADVTVYIAPSHHRRGAGRRLYTELLDRLRRQQFQVACAGVTLPNDASVGLHRAMGFEPIGVYRQIGWKMGAWRDVMWLELELVPSGDEPPAEPLPPV